MCAASSKILLSRSQRGPSVKEAIPRGGGPGPGPQIGQGAKERRLAKSLPQTWGFSGSWLGIELTKGQDSVIDWWVGLGRRQENEMSKVTAIRRGKTAGSAPDTSIIALDRFIQSTRELRL